MKKKVFLIIFVMLISPLFANPTLEEIGSNLSEGDITRVLEKGDCNRSTKDDGPGLVWLPNHYLGEKIADVYSEMNPGLAVEIVSFIPMDETSSEDYIIDVTNKFLAVSEQEGITYYSSTRKKEMVLIEKSYMVEKVGYKKAIPDSVFTHYPDTIDSIVYQKDSSFGGNHFLYHCEIFEDAAFLRTTNKTTMSVMGFFTVAKPDDNIMIYAIIPCETGVYIYTTVFVDDPPTQERIFGISVNIEGFFLKRVRKVVEWFTLNFTPR